MGWPKGKPRGLRGSRIPGSGRKKGTGNKITVAFKHAVLNVFNRVGGEDHLEKWAQQNQTEFYKIAARLIPTEITGSGEGGVIEILHRIKESGLDKKT